MQDNDERLRQAIRAGNIGIFEHDHETDTLYWSLELRQMYGWDPDEPAELPKIIGHVHPDDVERVVAAVRSAHDPQGEGAFDIEHRIVDRSGQVRWVLTRSKTNFGSVAGTRRPLRTIGAVQDVTERRRAEERLRILDTVLRSSAQVIAITDPRGVVTFANAALHRLWGYSGEQVLIGRSIFEFWKLSEDPAALLERVRASHLQSFEMPATRMDGSPFYLGVTAEAVCDTKGTLVQVLFTLADVTESRRVQEALRLKDQAIASSLTGIAMADASSKILYANREFLRLWGHVSDADVLDRSLWDFLEPSSASQISEVVGKGQPFQGEIAGKRADGTRMDLNVSVHALLDGNGAPANIVASIADVTDRKRLEAQLIHSQKIESVGRLAGGVAHDFNNLLTVISGGLELTLGELPVNDRSRDYLLAAADAAQSAAALTRQLLAFSRKEIIAPKVLDLNEVIRRVEKMITRLFGEDIALVTRCAENLAPIRFDPGQVEQIVLNLAVNARDALASGGHLTIETSNVHLDEEYAERHVDVQPGEYVLLAVSDDGVGMSEEVQAHLFEPFFTTKAAGKGTGLGLAMVYGAVRQNGGRIEVYSEINQGTTFKVYLPAARSVPEPVTPQPSTLPRMRTKSILLIEDDARVRLFAENVLKRLGHTVHTFPNGDEALAALGSLQPEPELLITDVVMPGSNGRVVAERVAAALPKIRVMFVSGYTENVIVTQGVLKEGIEFLAKPYSVEQLARRVSEILGESRDAPSPYR
jgi:two-component system, cell cycle sensor histidine kinase and response regulator CckA